MGGFHQKQMVALYAVAAGTLGHSAGPARLLWSSLSHQLLFLCSP